MGRTILQASWLLTLFGVAALSLAWQAPSPKPRATETPTAPTRLPEKLESSDQMLGKQVEPRPGEVCLVCNHPITSDDLVYAVHGHRIPLHAVACYGEFKDHPWKYLAILEPHGAFLGSGGEGQRLSLAWFLAGLYILVGLVFAALCAHQAMHRGHSPALWFGTGLVLNAFGYLLLVTRPRRDIEAPAGVPKGLHKVPATYEPRPCPACGQLNHPAAGECAGCGAKLAPRMESEVQRVGLR